MFAKVVFMHVHDSIEKATMWNLLEFDDFGEHCQNHSDRSSSPVPLPKIFWTPSYSSSDSKKVPDEKAVVYIEQTHFLLIAADSTVAVVQTVVQSLWSSSVDNLLNYGIIFYAPK